jgi:Tol biopolymer transport system component
MTDQDVREFFERLAVLEPIPEFDAEPLVRRGHRRLAQKLAGGALAVAAIVAALVGGASLLRTAPSTPAAPTGTTSGELPQLAPFRIGGEVLQHECCDGALEAVDPDTGQGRHLLDAEIGQAAWSPDGTRLAYDVPCSMVGGGGANQQRFAPCSDAASRSAGLHVTDASGERTLVASYSGSGQYYQPYVRLFAWSSDGTRLAYILLGDGLYVARADGSQPTRLASVGESWAPPSWSPDGSTIAYEADGAVSVVPAGGGQSTTLATEGRAPVWSPDGTTVAFGTQSAIFVVSPDGSDLTQVGDGYEFAWSPTGDRLMYHVENPVSGGFLEQLWVVDSDGSNPIAIVRSDCCAGIVDGTLTWSNGGQRVAFQASQGNGDPWRTVAPDGSEVDRSIEDLPDLGLTQVLSWRPCLCTMGYA